ncbi:ABC transporter substrate-binding protein [Pseudomonas tohonis]|uniref:ABC transporter substrate-binding protein n=1 Tax=Pseudomonas tohonis TaxID=2725477 RepID=A0A6J4E4P4_9PSED|nr:transporter substrate-binding domain-containing protein [Pseudomonas tohonis]BCG24345.1 ABC transporter substrate-binding protein [Pseudomonas tohonis]GJN52297.1 ABC transporter substrate-binding protein [Pseudomonas tohonis]
MSRFRVLLLICLLALARPLFAEGHIRIAIGEWPPLISASQPGNGVIPTLISEAFATQGITVEYGFFPWKRAFEEVRQGRWQASAVWGRSPEREACCLFSERVYSDEVVLFYNRAKPVHWDGSAVGVEQLRGLTIGLPLGSAKTPLLEEAERRGLLKYEAGGDETGNLRKLAAGRIDAVDMVKGTGQWLISQRLDADEAARLATTAPLQRWDYHLLFASQPADNRRYLEAFDKGLATLRANGREAELWRRFLAAPR